MKIDQVVAGFYWGVREKSLQDCAERAARFLCGLPERLGSLRTWFDLDGMRRHGGAAVKLSPKGLEPLLVAGRIFDDLGKPKPSLGFGLSLANRPQGDGVHLGLRCAVSSQWVSNSCVLCFPLGSSEYEAMLHPPLAIGLAKWVVRCWEPDSGVVTSGENMLRIELENDETQAGWLTYLSNRSYPTQIEIDGPVTVESVDNLGRLLVLEADRFSPSDPSQTEAVRSILDSINR